MHKKSTLLAIIIIGILFFIFGFVTWLNGSLIPFLKIICDLNDFQALFVTFAFYIAYTVMAFPMASVLEKTGYKKGMALGLFVMSLGALLFIPAAFSREFILFLFALFTLGTGLTILQTASNPYIVLVGPIESAAMRISIMGLINKAAGVLAPLAFTAFILSDLNSSLNVTSIDTHELAKELIMPYIIMATILFGLTLLILFSSLPELEFEDDPYDTSSIFAFPHLILGALALFFYVAIEVIAGDTIGLYGQSLGVADATSLTSYTMGFMVVGYLVGIFFIPRFLSQEKALIFSSLGGIFLLFGVAFSSTTQSNIIPDLPDSVAFVALLGLANALVWPTIWPLALRDLKKHTAKGSALLIMAIAGGALLPLAFGKVAQISADMQMSYLVGIICYAMIFMYGIKWHKLTSWSV